MPDRLPDAPITISVVGVTFAPGYPEHFVAIEKALMFNRTPEVFLARQPDNPVDPNAVQVWVETEYTGQDAFARMVGHVPAALAARLAPEMDEGTRWEGKVAEVRASTMERPGLTVTVRRVPPR